MKTASFTAGPTTLRAAIDDSIILLKSNEPPEGYVGSFSGGKDSIAIKELARLAGVKAEWHYHQTTIDPPELVRFIREHHPDVIWDRPRHGNMLRRAGEKKGFPTRTARWCCQEYKERRHPGVGILGVRIAESRARKQRWTACTMEHGRTHRKVVLPIRLWSDELVWNFIRSRDLPYCSLYDEGFTRLGCIGCPLTNAKQRRVEWQRWPRFKALWQRAFQRTWERRAGTLQRDGREWFGSALFDTWQELFQWWDDGQDNITKWRTKNGLRIKGANTEEKSA